MYKTYLSYYFSMSETTTQGADSSVSNFSFKYIESGGLTARYLLISFDSKTNNVNYSTDATGAVVSQRPISSESDLKGLKDVITREGFFRTQSSYSPTKDNEPYIASNLTITMDDKVHTVTWADTSIGVPDGLVKVTDEIKKLTGEKK